MKNINTILKNKKIVASSRPKKEVKIAKTFSPARTTKLSSLLTAMKVETVPTSTTANGALSFAKTGDAVLDYFSVGGAIRQKSESEVINLFQKAFNENALLAMKALFYFRDVRGGQGERKVVRCVLRWLATNYPNTIKLNLANIPFFGRWDDLFDLLNTSVEKDVLTFINNQLVVDLNVDNGSVSLLAKWLPSENASSSEGIRQARKIANFLKLTPRNYRKMLSYLREKIKIVERNMCAKDWSGINYEHVPSRAAMIYRKAFKKHDEARYTSFLSKVEKGEAKINAATLYPYDLVRNVRNGQHDQTIEAQWNNLPNYIGEKDVNILTICDVSSSMDQPVSVGLSAKDVAISLSLYTAERARGLFKNHFITFCSEPALHEISGKNLREKVFNLNGAPWGGNTDFQAALNLILETAVRAKIPKKDMPTHLICVSDMAFDIANAGNNKTNFEVLKEKYKKAGYTQPIVVFWRVDQKSKESPAKANDKNVVLVSGFSPSVFESILSFKTVTPYDLMLAVLNKERYDSVVI